MKRILIPGLMLVAALALTNCAEQLETPLQENDIVVEETMGALSEDCVPYEVFVESAETKTNYQDGRTSWIQGVDEIALFHRYVKDSKDEYQYHSKFVYAGSGAFSGNLVNSETLADKNDWYAIYPYNSSSAATITAYPVTIGAEVQTQTQAGSMYDIAGPNCPLFGIKNGVSRKNKPKFKMSHMFAVIALNIVNNGDGGDIVVKSAGIKAAEEIVGGFDVNILGNPSENIYDPVFTKKTNSKNSTKVELKNAVVVGAGKSATLYLAVKPFDASGKELTISINGNAEKGNGVSKTIKMPSNSKFEAGKITTITVPVEKLSFGSTVTNLLDDNAKIITGVSWFQEKTKSVKMLQMTNSSEMSLVINGKNVTAYVLGNGTDVGTVKLSGKAPELMRRLPVQFYASSMDGNKAVMRLENIHVDLNGFNLLFVEKSMGFSELTTKVSADRIKFKGLLPIEIHNNTITILDEEPFHKKVDESSTASLLSRFDQDLTDDKVPTYQGLYDAITNPSSIKTPNSEAAITAEIVHEKLKPVLDTVLGDLSFVGDFLFGEPYDFFSFLSTYVSCEVTLSTVPVGTDGATDNRVLIWGLNSSNSN